MTDIKVTPLGKIVHELNCIVFYKNRVTLFLQTNSGAGQDVGRSCILLQMGGKNIMLDCGMHMGYNDEVIWLFSQFHSSSFLTWFALRDDFQISRS